MQKTDQFLSEYTQAERDLMMRQKRFALILSGDDQWAEQSVQHLVRLNGGRGQGKMSAAAFQFYQLKKLYEMWMEEGKQVSSSQNIFQTGQENEAIQRGLDPTIARLLGELPSLHRAMLLLIHGEDFSYVATAQLLNISIEDLMSTLSDTRSKFMMSQNGNRVGPSHLAEGA